MKCPGQDLRFWKPGDIFETLCPACGAKVEFFKDEVRRKCRCGHEMVNPKIDFGCAAWCPYAEQCVGMIPEEVKAKQRAEQKDLLKERIALEVKKYLGTDFKRLKHALNVARWAEQILKREGGNPLIVLGAAYLHVVIDAAGAIRKDEKRASTGQGEKEGVTIAREILKTLGVENEWIEEICHMIEQLHHPGQEGTLNSRILCEAHGLANIQERVGREDQEHLEKMVAETFKTSTGREMAADLLHRP
jgi:hypothetical protein